MHTNSLLVIMPKKKEYSLNDVLQRIQEGLLTQNLNLEEVKILEGRFGHDWFHQLGYDQIKTNKEPKFTPPK